MAAGIEGAMNGLTQGIIQGISGGDILQGISSGSISSLVSTAVGMGGTAAGIDGTKIGGTLFFGTVSGGFGAVLTNGNFWQGAATGLIVSGLNHVAHRIAYPFNNKSTIDIENNNENTDPPYKYNNKTYESKEELYGAILLDQASEQLGIKDVVSLAAAVDYQGWINKPYQME